MTAKGTASNSGLTLALSWLAVGLPILWGIGQTIRKALPLLTGG